MEVIISLIVIVALITFYDYFAARSWQQVTSSVRNEIVFEHRNKEYGAYVLRNEYDKRLMFIMLGLVLAIGLSFGTYMFIKNLPEEKEVLPPIDTTQFTVAAPPEEDVPPPPKEELPPPMEKTVAFMPPVVVDIPVEDEIPPQEAMEDTKADTKNNDTENENFAPPVVGDDTPPVVQQKEEEPEMIVEEEAEFPGGFAAMMAFIQKNLNYPQEAIENNIQGKCYLQFVVDKQGDVSKVQLVRGISGCPECDKEAMRVVRMMRGFKPAKIKGRSVTAYFRMPIDFRLE
jgi:protein TonB